MHDLREKKVSKQWAVTIGHTQCWNFYLGGGGGGGGGGETQVPMYLQYTQFV